MNATTFLRSLPCGAIMLRKLQPVGPVEQRLADVESAHSLSTRPSSKNLKGQQETDLARESQQAHTE
jgi:hypothetical protein